MRTSFALLVLVATAPPEFAQSEDQLRTFFEGKTVRVRNRDPVDAGVPASAARPSRSGEKDQG